MTTSNDRALVVLHSSLCLIIFSFFFCGGGESFHFLGCGLLPVFTFCTNAKQSANPFCTCVTTPSPRPPLFPKGGHLNGRAHHLLVRARGSRRAQQASHGCPKRSLGGPRHGGDGGGDARAGGPSHHCVLHRPPQGARGAVERAAGGGRAASRRIQELFLLAHPAGPRERKGEASQASPTQVWSCCDVS